MRASSYLPLPKELKTKRRRFNIQSKDEKSFIWSILASPYPVQHRNSQHSVSKYQEYEHEGNISGIQYPVDIKDLKKNKTLVSISMNTKMKNLSVTYYHHDC